MLKSFKMCELVHQSTMGQRRAFSSNGVRSKRSLSPMSPTSAASSVRIISASSKSQSRLKRAGLRLNYPTFYEILIKYWPNVEIF